MSETVELIAQLNARWRVLRIEGRPGWGPPCWLIENPGGNHRGAVFRVSAMLRDYLTSRAGTIHPDAAAILEALPERCDRDRARPPPLREKKRRAQVVRPAVVVSTPQPTPQPKKRSTAPTGGRDRLAAKFLSWRAQYADQ
jgi:hypothetical protein